MPPALGSITDLYRAHAGHVFRRARQLLGNDADAHEVVQDVFVSLLERPEQYAGRSAFTTFLYSATTHACLNRLRNQRTRARLLEVQGGPLGEGASTSPEQRAELLGLLRRMPEELARAAVYHHFDDLTQDEIARILTCSRRHVGNLLARVAEWIQRERQHVD